MTWYLPFKISNRENWRFRDRVSRSSYIGQTKLSNSVNYRLARGLHGCQNNTAVAVSRFKPIQCIACRFLRWLYVSRVDPLLSWVSFGKSDFQEKHFYNQLHAIPIVNWFLKVLSMPIPLYSMWQVYQTCSLLRLLRAPTCCKKKKKKKKSCL